MERVHSRRAPTVRLLVTAVVTLLVPLIAKPQAASGAGLLVADGGLGGQLQLKDHDVRVTINNGIAVTTVSQVFQNMENRQVEALYTFPVPKSASVANFSMWINGKEMVGEVVEKDRARQIYNSYKQQKRDPGLLEQVDYKTFEMRVFPIAPRGEQRVQVTYYQELGVDHDWATYVYPLATTSRGRPVDSTTHGRFALNVEAKSEVPLVEMSSPSHKDGFAIAKHADGYWQASLETREGDLNRDVVLAYKLSRPKTGVDLITTKSDGEDGYFCLTLTAGEELAAQAAAGMDYVFVLDVSGSMADDGKLDLSRRSLGAFVRSLKPADRFDVVAFNVQPTPLFGSLSAGADDAKAKADEFLAQRKPAGGTVLHPAITAAYRYASPERTLNVVILSDGLTETGETSQLAQLIQQRPKNCRVFSIGVGNDVNRALLEDVAEKSGGLAAFLSRGDDFERQAQAFRRKLEHPAATDVKIDLDGAEVYDIEPKQLPNLYHGSPIRMYGRYKRAGNAKVHVRATINDKPLDQAIAVELPGKDGGNPEIERMWAWHRVQRLLKEADANGSRMGASDEIVRLGEGYSIATEYTSFIVLENDAEYQRWQIKRRNALRVERDRNNQVVLQEQLERMREAAANKLGPTPLASAATSAPVQLIDTAMDSVNQPTAAAPATATPQFDNSPRRGRDLAIPSAGGGGGGGGGAIDPVAAILILGCVAAAFVGRAARKQSREEHGQ
jgi:Ca-activated chloride channel family protein